VIDAVVDEDPFCEIGGIGGIEGKFDEIQAGFANVGAVAFGAIFFDEGAGGAGKVGRGERGGEEEGERRED